jgi:hypothetical protein
MKRHIPYLAILVSLAIAAAPAFAATGFHVVPVHGTVAGEGYAYYLKRLWQTTIATSPPAKPCQTLNVNGHKVGLLTLKTLKPMKESYTCSEPAGRPLYADMLSSECSTFNGDHGKYGTSDSQLEKCARALFKGARNTATVDGRPVNVTKLVATTRVYRVHLPKKNIFGSNKAGKGRSAAHGYGLLLTGLSRGTHVIHAVFKSGSTKWDITWSVPVYKSICWWRSIPCRTGGTLNHDHPLLRRPPRGVPRTELS